MVIIGPHNGGLHPLGGCGVSTSIIELTQMRVETSKSREIAQVGCKLSLACLSPSFKTTLLSPNL